MQLRRRARWAVAAAALAACAAALWIPTLIGASGELPARVQRLGGAPAEPDGDVLRLVSLNLAHGRADGRFQALQPRTSIEGNLDEAAELLERLRPQVVALQEVDGPSLWSGRFDHLERVARSAGLPWALHSRHVSGLGLHYGSGLLLDAEPLQARSFTFEPSPPTMNKGATLARVPMPGGEQVTVVSVHLDYLQARVRERQARELAAWLQDQPGPLVLAGDFNCQWVDEEDTLRFLAAALRLRGWRPEAEDLATYPGWQRRLDWILISPELEFVDHRVLPEVVSDHRAVLAELRLRPSGEAQIPSASSPR